MNDDWEQFEEVPLDDGSSKRCGVSWAPWMGDWFISYSPRNGNSNAEGTWDHWTQLAIAILQHDATAIVRPEAHEAVKNLTNTSYYSESGRQLEKEELERLFR
jgi:hypothetical protein